MTEPHGDKEPGWWSRVQEVAKAIVALSGDAAMVAEALRRIFGY